MVLSATFMSLFDVFVVNVAAPSIQHDLHASSSTLELVVAGYSFSYAAGLVTGARLGDLFGRRRLFMIGLGHLRRGLAALGCGSDQRHPRGGPPRAGVRCGRHGPPGAVHAEL